ncbi:exo-beta-N-acetylmuramidase NamZ family protein [Paucisalibacillus globulus]|uniref:exo-beta-N-acetylmuramidase NamZ family protein n=1 Tax=Paucisalibacillus globulus TaxID=351095 RepID=UPI0003FFB9FA|nr:DUF1343 domain-containing protein [Paucisalibacillus globulus]
MKLGLDIFLETGYKEFQNQRIGLVTNMTGVDQRLNTTIDLFFEHSDIRLVALYGPEHGIRGNAKEGEKVTSSIDNNTKLPAYSLYGETRRPSKEMMENVDVIVFDMQDIGSRYYTYIYTMAYVMEACAQYNKKMIVLDRPNPIAGITMEGNLVEEDVRSFVGLLPIPNRHGMTIGELAWMFRHEFGYTCDLTVVPMKNWTRNMYYDETGLLWVPPSPNTTNLDMNLLYTGTCLFEGTNISEGRGTTRPFEWIGAPFIDGQKLAKHVNKKRLPGVLARPVTFSPTYQKYNGQVCEGVQLHIIDREQVHSLKTGLTLLESIVELYPSDFQFVKNDHGKYFFDLLAGTKKLRTDIMNIQTDDFFEECNKQLIDFEKVKKQYHLYK